MNDSHTSEVEFHDVGTEARVFDFSQTEKGILAVVASGERRFVVDRAESASDGIDDWPCFLCSLMNVIQRLRKNMGNY